MKNTICPKCKHHKLWSIRRNRQRCAQCRYEWQPGRLPLQLNRNEWKKVIRLFLLELSSEKIANETNLERRRVLRALMWVRRYLSEEIPEELKTQRNFKFPESHETNLSTSKTPARPMFGILFKNGKVWAELISQDMMTHLLPLGKKQVPPGSVISFDIWKHYAGIVTRGYLHRLSGIDSNENKSFISELESFWSFLKRKLSSKGGVRRSRLPLYLSEYNWRYNQRDKSSNDNLNTIMNLLKTKKI